MLASSNRPIGLLLRLLVEQHELWSSSAEAPAKTSQQQNCVPSNANAVGQGALVVVAVVVPAAGIPDAMPSQAAELPCEADTRREAIAWDAVHESSRH